MQYDIAIKMSELESHILIFINLHNIIVIEENSWNMTLKHDTIYVKSKDI